MQPGRALLYLTAMRRFRLQKPARESSPLKPREWVDTPEDREEVRKILAKHTKKVYSEGQNAVEK